MTDIKMSDVFELPVNEAMIHNGDLCRRESGHACIAINAYDANQKHIDELEGFIAKLLELGGWYTTAIELDFFADGEELETEAKKLIGADND